MADKKEIQAILDKAQVEAAPYFKDRSNVVEYCNACINSGLGAVAHHYGEGNPMADIGAFTILSIWIETIKERIAAVSPNEVRH